jgi:hypothetical protein
MITPWGVRFDKIKLIIYKYKTCILYLPFARIFKNRKFASIGKAKVDIYFLGGVFGEGDCIAKRLFTILFY